MPKTVVFGGAGFLGSHLADELTERGHEVIIFDKKPSPCLREHQRCIVGDILDMDTVRNAIAGCDVVYNFAGVADIEQAKKNPLETVKNNILGTTILLESARKAEVKRFIFASSLYVYSDAGSFYRSSKQACELLIDNYYTVYGLNYTILRYGSLYGPRADEDNWIYCILKQALTEGRITRNGDGEELREYIHAQDAARLSADVMDQKYRNQHVIITGNQQMKIRDLLMMIKEMMEGKIEIEYAKSTSKEHYEITPYIFKPKLAKRLRSDHYIDLGEGILEMLGSIYSKLAEEKSSATAS